jgi:poly(hydroxyalkanoate) depolymerase family esterase
MYTYVPQGVPANAPLVLALHGCTEAATDYESAGWDALAETYKFYVVYPQQQSANNIEECFNWFGNTSGSLADITRGQGEAASVAQMVDYMKTTYSIDNTRVFATGFSGGAAYAVALLAMYPDVFAAGASFSGIPFGCATSEISAFSCMDGPTTNTPAQWGALVKAAYPGFTGTYPRITIWQGSEDTTVNTANLGEIVSQWTNVTGVSATATTTNAASGYTYNGYADANGVVRVESYSITGMPHAVAVDPTTSCGTTGTYFDAESICAADYAAKFFGIEGTPSGSPPANDAGVVNGGGTGGNGNAGNGGSSGGSGGSGGNGNAGSGGNGGSGASTGTGGNGATPAADDDAGTAAAPPPMPGCTVAAGSSPANGAGLVALALGIAGLVARRRRSGVGSRALGVGLAAVTLLALTASPARADEGEAAEAPVKVPAGPGYMGPQGAFFTGAAVSTTPAVLFGYFPVDHLATTVGLGFTYNANGSPTSPLTGIKGESNNHVGSDFFLDVMYFVHDKAPFAMGPELNVIGSLSPNYPLTMIVVTPMLALRYAPWKAPIAIGTGLGMSLAFERGAKPVASLATQGLDIVYAF